MGVILGLPLAWLAVECATARAQTAPRCDDDNGGLILPTNFCALVIADVNAKLRHIFVRANGEIYAAAYPLDRRNPAAAPGGIFLLRDLDGDGKSDLVRRFGPEHGGTGLALHEEWLYFATDNSVLRYRLSMDGSPPTLPPDTIVAGLPESLTHAAKSIAISGSRLYVNIGAPSNTCQVSERALSPGMDPCPQLDEAGGIWAFDRERVGQRLNDGERYATGIRNAVAIGVDPHDGQLYAVQHGRDWLFHQWSETGHFSAYDGAERVAEELLKVERGADYGWPYCYYDPIARKKVLAPEYGGDGKRIERCAMKKDPLYAFPAHWAPNDMLFYTGRMLPSRYHEGVFVAFHGSWNRAPLPQAGFQIAFLPLNGGEVGSDVFETFADGFAGPEPDQPGHRPAGLAEGPDGSMFVTDDRSGRIWRIIYRY